MLEASGVVVALEGDSLWVETQPRSSCSHCSSMNCTTSVIAKLFSVRRNRLELHNCLGVKTGDQVIIGIPDKLLVRASIWAYLTPLVAMLIITAIGNSVGASEGFQALLALLGLAGGFVLVSRFTGTGASTQKFKPRLIRMAAPRHQTEISVSSIGRSTARQIKN